MSVSFVGSATATAASINLSGTGRQAGDLLVVSGFDSASTPAGWTMVGAAQCAGSAVNRPLWTKTSDGTEGSVSFTGATRLTATVWRPSSGGTASVTHLGDSTTSGAEVFYASLAGLDGGSEELVLYTVTLTTAGGGATTPPNPASVTERARAFSGTVAIQSTEPGVSGTIPQRTWTWGGLESAIRVRTYAMYYTPPTPPGTPTGLAVDPAYITADFSWSAAANADGYEVRVNGGTATDVGNVLAHTLTGLTSDTVYNGPGAEVRSYNTGGFSSWASLAFTTPAVPPPVSRVLVGDLPADIFAGCTLITIRRGLTPDGVVEKPEPGVGTFVLKGEAYNPLDNADVRPGRSIQLVLHIEDETDPHDIPVFTGTIKRAVVGIDKDTGIMLTTVTAFDAIATLAATAYTQGHAGNLTQRLTPVLDAAAVDYVITDTAPALVPGSLPTDKKTVLEQLVLVRDTMHAAAFVDRENVVQVIADKDRSEAPATVTLADGDYVGLDLGFDTDDLVNVLTVERLTTGDPVVETVDVPDLVTEWGKAAQSVTVNDGANENHALRFMARLPGPDLVAKEIRVNGTLEGFELVAALEIYDPVQVVRDGLLDVEQQIVHLTHTITPRDGLQPKWMTDLVVRQRDIRPLRWDDVPGTITWDDLDPAMTWNTAVFWTP